MGDQHAPEFGVQRGYRAEWLPGFGIKGDYGLCDSDATDLCHVAGTYDLPFGRGRMFWDHQQGRRSDSRAGGSSTSSTPSRAGSRSRLPAPSPPLPTSVALPTWSRDKVSTPDRTTTRNG